MLNYRVYPNDSSVTMKQWLDLIKEKIPEDLGASILYWIIVWGITLFVLFWIGSRIGFSLSFSISVLIIFLIGFLGISFLWNYFMIKKENAQNTDYEANHLSTKLNGILEESSKITDDLPQLLDSAAYAVQQAEEEFKENDYTAFWDAIEHAAQYLYAFNDGSKKLSANAQAYYQSLKDRKHNFPAFVLTSATLPDPIPVVNELQRVARMARKNFEFAMIWEQRQTRKVLMAGFHTLGEAINNLGMAIENTMADLQYSVSSGFKAMEDEAWKIRDQIDTYGKKIRK